MKMARRLGNCRDRVRNQMRIEVLDALVRTGWRIETTRFTRKNGADFGSGTSGSSVRADTETRWFPVGVHAMPCRCSSRYPRKVTKWWLAVSKNPTS